MKRCCVGIDRQHATEGKSGMACPLGEDLGTIYVGRRAEEIQGSK